MFGLSVGGSHVIDYTKDSASQAGGDVEGGHHNPAASQDPIKADSQEHEEDYVNGNTKIESDIKRSEGKKVDTEV